MLVALDKAWHGEAVLHQGVGIRSGSSEQLTESVMLWVLMIALLDPLGDPIAAPDNHVEEGVEEKDPVSGLKRVGRQKHRHGRSVE